MKLKPIDELKKRLKEISHLVSILSLLYWDQEVYMPEKASDARAASIAELSGIVHTKFISLDSDGLLSKLNKQLAAKKLTGQSAVIVSETWRTYDRERKLPEAFVRELAETASKSQRVWVEARKNDDFKMFLPWLSKIVKLKQREAEYIGYEESPYDALIDAYEPGMTAERASVILDDLKDFLAPFVKKVVAKAKKVDPKKIRGIFPIDRQAAFNEMVIAKMGFDLRAGRVDKTTHPFASGFHPQDVRITTRYDTGDVTYSLGSIIHEAGHGLYEQGLPVEHFGTPIAEAISLGIHESQSRLWENLIGKSKPFWRYFYPRLQKEFPVPFQKVPLEDFYGILNEAKPSLIRTESDEVTYNLHIILRFEIEKEMIEGTIDLKDLPKIWKSKMKSYFGIDVPNDRLGVLQDVHWSSGGIGYFPTYSFGNLYAAQFFAAMKKDIPDIEKRMSKGEFGPVREWLRKKIHMHGKTFKAEELVKRVTGESLNSYHFIEYLKSKYKV